VRHHSNDGDEEIDMGGRVQKEGRGKICI